MPLTNEQQRHLERRLRDERERAIELLNDIVADRSSESQQEETGDLTVMPYHPADLGTDTMDEELDASNATRVSRELKEIDAALDRATRAFLASPGALTVTDGKNLLRQPTVTITASKIFDWYAKDFKASGGALAFIEKYGPADVVGAIRKAGSSARIAYQDYDWSLNSAP